MLTIEVDLHGCTCSKYNFQLGQAVKIKGYKQPRKVAG
jgi:hypothetical protein